MASDVIVSQVTYSGQELTLRLNQKWRFLTVDRRKVRIHGEHIADYEKRGPKVFLTPLGPREAVRWVAWAIQELCPEASAYDEEASPPDISEPPMAPEEVEKLVLGIEAARHAAIAKEADPSGGGHEAVALVTYLVKRKSLELVGAPGAAADPSAVAAVARAVVPILKDVDDEVGSKLEDALLDLDEVEELYAGAEELTKMVQNNDHIFDR